ncbi:hypothetical protein V5799_000730, partial [Amblyomma americanum]
SIHSGRLEANHGSGSRIALCYKSLSTLEGWKRITVADRVSRYVISLSTLEGWKRIMVAEFGSRYAISLYQLLKVGSESR